MRHRRRGVRSKLRGHTGQLLLFGGENRGGGFGAGRFSVGLDLRHQRVVARQCLRLNVRDARTCGGGGIGSDGQHQIGVFGLEGFEVHLCSFVDL